MSVDLGAYERAFLRVCFDASPSDADLAVLGDRARYLVYREMVRVRLRELLESALPQTREALGAERFRALCEEHMTLELPRTRYIRELAGPFARWLLGRVGNGDVEERPWLRDLVTFELARWEIGWREVPAVVASGELDFERALLVNPAHELLSLAHAVHEEKSAAGGWAARPVSVIVYRRPADHMVGTFVVNAITAELFRAWVSAKDTEGVMATVQRVASARGTVVDAAFVDGLCTVLADFVERGIVLGAR